MKTRLIGFAAATALAGIAAFLTAPSLAQPQQSPPPSATSTAPPRQQFVWPARISNARALPANIGADQLRSTMVGFSRSLGVRCTFCHVGVEGQPLSTFDFPSDARPNKTLARGMIRMVARLNERELPAILGAAQAPRVTCYTCHRGSTTPETALPPLPPRPAQPPSQPSQAAQPGH
jgi:hypothetical protein